MKFLDFIYNIFLKRKNQEYFGKNTNYFVVKHFKRFCIYWIYRQKNDIISKIQLKKTLLIKKNDIFQLLIETKFRYKQKNLQHEQLSALEKKIIFDIWLKSQRSIGHPANQSLAESLQLLIFPLTALAIQHFVHP